MKRVVNIVPGIFMIPLKFVKYYELYVNKCRIDTDIDLLPNIQCHFSAPSATYTKILKNEEDINDRFRDPGFHITHFIKILLQDILNKP